MPTFTNQQLLTELRSIVVDMTIIVKDTWRLLPEEILLYKETPEKWSAAQCLMHLNSYGNYYLPAMETSIEKAEVKGWLSDHFTGSIIGNWFTQLMLPKEGKPLPKMKAPKNHTPTINDKSEKAIQVFLQQATELIELLNRAEPVDLRKAKAPISISRYIRLPLGDTFRFYIAHHQRHMQQATRAVAAAKFAMQMNDGAI